MALELEAKGYHTSIHFSKGKTHSQIQHSLPRQIPSVVFKLEIKVSYMQEIKVLKGYQVKFFF